MSWIADNFLKFSLILLAVFAFLIRGDLLSDDSHADTAVESQVVAKLPVIESPAHSRTVYPDTDEAAPAQEESEAQPAQEQKNDKPTSVEPDQQAAKESVEHEAVAAVAEPSPASQTENATQGAKDTEEFSIKEYWVAARTAYWVGDFAAAEREYQNILSRESENWQAHKELGNLYARARYFDMAVAEYQAATLILNEAGMYEQSRELAVIMAELYPAWKDKPVSGLQSEN